MHSCKECLGQLFDEDHYRLVQAESEHYMARASQQQEWDGTEAPLQLLLLPSPAGEKLPAYSAQPGYLSPNRCRLCLQEVEPAAFDLHLRQEHQMSHGEYRHHVLSRILAEWPQPITSQILRTRLAAYKEEFCDANFRVQPCAVCAREKRPCKLLVITFPPADSAQPPAWLPWAAQHWQSSRAAWFRKVDELLNIDRYLQNTFLADERIEVARREVMAFSGDAPGGSEFLTVEAAQAWLERLQVWRKNLHDDLQADSIPAPSHAGS